MTGTVSDWLAKAYDDLRTVELLEAVALRASGRLATCIL